MILTSCIALGLGTVSAMLVFAFGLPNLGRVLDNLKRLDFQGVKLANPFALPIGVPAMAVLAFVISVSTMKEIKVDNHTLITYKKCEKKEAVAVVKIKVPGCLIASR